MVPAASAHAAAIPASPVRAVAPYVHVDDVRLEAKDGKAVVTARVRWNQHGVDDYVMTGGDLRLVAVSEQGHLPVLLAKSTQDVTDDRPVDVTFTISDENSLAAMRKGNRIVLTASQHRYAGQRTRSTRTYVTVAEVQPFGSPQPHIGTDDCSDIAIVPGAMLRYCDLTGAFLNAALVSIHDPKSDEGRVDSKSTRMERADLTGATAVRSDFSGASIAGGRLNGLDLTDAKLDNLSLAGAEAVELIARGATSDKDARDSGANFFHTNLTGADLSQTVFRGVSVGRARLDQASLAGATWESIGDGATFRNADLNGASMGASLVNWVDFTDADLSDSTLTDLQLDWTYLCRTTMPTGSKLDGSRDCGTAVEHPHDQIASPDQATPFVSINKNVVSDAPGPRTVKARINWDASAASASGFGMTIGDLRLLAVDRTTGVPTVLDTKTYNDVSSPSDYEVTISDGDKLAAMNSGNRIVLTATQHPPRARSGKNTTRSYVTVAVLQPGPGNGRIGSLDCSGVALTADSPRSLDFCDLSGAMLDTAALVGRFMREVDLTGATIQDGLMAGLSLDGSRLGGLKAAGADVSNVAAFDAWAPRLDLSNADVKGSPLYPRNLDGANFNGSTLSDSPLVAASLRQATFSNATLIHPDLAYTDLSAAQLDRVDASLSNPSLFLANLTGADMTKSKWNVDEGRENPWKWATLCQTKVPTFGISGNRDCPR
jgi:uncharacterized protein YjbI with pentapeptide repeats